MNAVPRVIRSNTAGLRRVVLLAALPATTAVIPLVVIPILTSRFGGQAWVAVALGISVGTAAAVLVELGWGLTGAMRTARAHDNAKLDVLAIGIVTKSLVAIGLLPFVLVISFLIAQKDFKLLTVGVSLAYMSMGLTSSWFYIGSGRILLIFMTDVLPRLAFTGMSILWISLFDASILIYPACLIVSGIMSAYLPIPISKLKRSHFQRCTKRRVAFTIRKQLDALGARVLSALYIALPLTLLTLVNPGAALLFSAGERPMRMALGILQSVPNALQPFVGGAKGPHDLKKRVLSAVLLNAALGAIVGLSFFFAGPWLVRILFSDTVRLTDSVTLLVSLIMVTTCTSRAVGSLGLVAYRKVKSIALSSALGAAFGITLVLILGDREGANGAFLGVLAAELLVLGSQCVSLYRSIGKTRVPTNTTNERV